MTTPYTTEHTTVSPESINDLIRTLHDKLYYLLWHGNDFVTMQNIHVTWPLNVSGPGISGSSSQVKITAAGEICFY